MRRDNYQSPTMEVINLEIEGVILAGSVGDIKDGGDAW